MRTILTQYYSPGRTEPPRAHFVGATGSGMKGLAEVLLDDGWSLTGSDTNPSARSKELLVERGMEIHSGHSSDHLSADLDLVVYSAAVPETNCERLRASELKIPQRSYFETLGEILTSRRVIAVAGTHGKSSTTARIVDLLEQTCESPTFFCGAERMQDGRNGRLGTGTLAIVEACEYRSHFLNLQPELICLLNIEHDHFDCFPSLSSMLESYQSFISSLPAAGLLCYSRASTKSRQLGAGAVCRSISYAIDSDHADFSLCSLLNKFPRHATELLSLPQYQQENLTAALATLVTLGKGDEIFSLAPEQLTRPLLRRRNETIESGPLGLIIDDYAHHATEVLAVLNAVRVEYPGHRIRCCFQPHQVSRTRKLHIEFVNALSIADEIYLLPVFGARESTGLDFYGASELLVKELVKAGKRATMIRSLDQVWTTLETDACPNDILLTLGAGDIARIYDERT